MRTLRDEPPALGPYVPRKELQDHAPGAGVNYTDRQRIANLENYVVQQQQAIQQMGVALAHLNLAIEHLLVTIGVPLPVALAEPKNPDEQPAAPTVH